MRKRAKARKCRFARLRQTAETRAQNAQTPLGFARLRGCGLARFLEGTLQRHISTGRHQRVPIALACRLHAEALGWTANDLFGADRLKPYARIDHPGLLMLVGGKRIVALSADVAVVEGKTGIRQTYRCSTSNGPPAWELAQVSTNEKPPQLYAGRSRAL